jgi:hypothetical protein
MLAEGYVGRAIIALNVSLPKVSSHIEDVRMTASRKARRSFDMSKMRREP